MALLLPPSTNTTEEEADIIIRDLESIRPISRVTTIASWLTRLMRLRTQPDSDLDLLTCACARILRALPVTDDAQQWATFVMLRATPDAALIQKVLNVVIQMHSQLVDLHAFTMQAATPTPEQLEVRLRNGSVLLIDSEDERTRLTPTQMDAVRAGYLRLREAVLRNV